MAGKKRNGSKRSNAPVAKDDGTRWVVVDEDGQQVYGGSGVIRGEAQRLAEGLVKRAEIRQVI